MIREENEKLLNEVLKNLHKSTLAIPVLKNYKVIEEESDAIFIAVSEDHSVQQYLEDGRLEDNETFEERLKKVIEETKKTMLENGIQDKELLYLGILKSDPFRFSLYLQDNIKNGVIVRQLNAYFIEPESRYFYEITLAAPPVDLETSNEYVIKNLLDRLTFILTHIKYNESCPI